MFGLLKPSSFKRDPYGYITNQISHVYLGLYMCTTYCWFVYVTSGIYPSQVTAVIVSTFFYALYWEIIRQGWRGFDTLEDIFYTFWGSSFFLVIEMDWVIERMFIGMSALFIPLFAGAYHRGRTRS